jgi:ribonuclease P protein component
VGGSLDMLRSKRDFAALQGASRSRAHPLLVLRFRRNALERNRFGISTGKRLGGAVVRNRVRRRIRETLRGMDGTTGGWDVLVVARPASATATYSELRDALHWLMRSLRTMEGTPRS